MDEERTIEEFLGDQPRAERLAEMRRVLETRLRRLRADLPETPEVERAALETRIETLKEQVAALEQEELITRFVEDSVRVTLAMGSVVDGDSEA
jgi:hypothetical protein